MHKNIHTLYRYSSNTKSTLGHLHIGHHFECYTLEDQFAFEKVAKESRIPSDIYELVIQEAITPLTKKYQERHPDFFERHIMIKNVDNYTNVYLHEGVHDGHTEACILLGDGVNNNDIERGKLSDSGQAFERWYKKTFPLLKQGEKVYLKIIDLDFPINI